MRADPRQPVRTSRRPARSIPRPPAALKSPDTGPTVRTSAARSAGPAPCRARGRAPARRARLQTAADPPAASASSGRSSPAPVTRLVAGADLAPHRGGQRVGRDDEPLAAMDVATKLAEERVRARRWRPRRRACECVAPSSDDRRVLPGEPRPRHARRLRRCGRPSCSRPRPPARARRARDRT